MKMIFFDTNFFEKKEFTKIDLSELTSKGYELYTSQIVVNEIKWQVAREIKEKYNAIKQISDNPAYGYYLFPLGKYSLDLEEAYKRSDKEITKFFNQFFKDKVIETDTAENMMNTLFERYRFKTPPFCSNKNSSDKGWKDTLIWTDFCKFASKHQYTDFVFISADSVFIDNKSELETDFRNICGDSKKVTIINKLDINGILKELEGTPKKDKKEEIQKTDFKKLDQSEIQNSIFDFAFDKSEIDINGNAYDIDRFYLYKNATLEICEDLCNTIENSMELFEFHRDVDLSSFIIQTFGSGYARNNIEINKLNNFINCWSNIKNNYSEKKNAFLQLLKDYLNRMVHDPEEVVDLPF